MSKRVERIAAEVLGRDAAVITDALSWAGTFHGVGARLLRDYAPEIGLDPAFTIHDREDSADLMNLARHELGYSKTESRFPTKGTCLAIYSRAGQRAGAARRNTGPGVPLVRRLDRGTEGAVCSLCRGQAGAERAGLRRPASLLGADGGGAGDRRASGRPLRPYPRRRISGHQPASGVDPDRAETGWRRADCGRRRRAVDLLVSRGGGPQHPGFSKAVRRACRHRHAGTELSLDRDDPGSGQRGDRRGFGTLHQEFCGRSASPPSARSSSVSATKPRKPTMPARQFSRNAKSAPR